MFIIKEITFKAMFITDKAMQMKTEANLIFKYLLLS